MSLWKLSENDELTMLDEQCSACGFLLHYLRNGELVECIPTEFGDANG